MAHNSLSGENDVIVYLYNVEWPKVNNAASAL